MATTRRAVSWLVATALVTAQPAVAQPALVTAQPAPGPDVAPYASDPASGPAPSRDELIGLLREKVKYVFVIFNENHSFDNEFGTLPGRQRPLFRRHRPARRRRTRRASPRPIPTPAAPPTPSRRSASARSRTPPSSTASTTATPVSPASSHVVDGTPSMDGSPQTNTTGSPRMAARPPGDGHAVRPPGDEPHRLRHHPVLLAIRQPVRTVRQHLRHRRHALDPERHRHDRRPGRRDPVGQARQRSAAGCGRQPQGQRCRRRRWSTIRSLSGARSSTPPPAPPGSRTARRRATPTPTSPPT